MSRYPLTLVHYDNKVIELDSSRVLVAFRQPIDRENAQAVAHRFGLKLEEEDQQGATGPSGVINHTDRRYWMKEGSGQEIADSIYAKLEAFRSVSWISPVYWPMWSQKHHARFSPLPHVLLVRYHRTMSAAKIKRIEKKHRLKFDENRSRYLGHLHFYTVSPRTSTAYVVRYSLEKEPGVISVHFSSMPMHSPLATFTPRDEHFADQWNLQRIGAEVGWDLTRGHEEVIIGILDNGCNLDHEDLRDGFDGPGFNAQTLESDGSTTDVSESPGHGTKVAGVAAARIDNDGTEDTALGVSGVAGECQIRSIAIPNYTEDEVVIAIEDAVEAGVSVINMSFRDPDNTWDRTMINEAIANAYHEQVVLVAAAGNQDRMSVAYPALHENVIAVGAIDRGDERAIVPAGEYTVAWGSNYGPALNVVAPGVGCWTTLEWGNYGGSFGGTSAATPHVSGLAALLRSRYSNLDPERVRNVIEQTCEKINRARYTYEYTDAHPNGPWHDEVGYGLIRIDRVLDHADVYIRDNSHDDGGEPSEDTFWDSPDIAVKHEDDGVFDEERRALRLGETNYVYVQVTNLGPAEARNVEVKCRAVPFVATEFQYGADWASAADDTHIEATSVDAAFTSISAAAGSNTALARFSLSAEQVESIRRWTEDAGGGEPGHPCLLAEVQCDNDYREMSDEEHVWESNNLGQRNVSVFYIGELGPSPAWPFYGGHPESQEPYFVLVIDRHDIPAGFDVYLDPVAPAGVTPSSPLPSGVVPCTQVTFLERTRLGVSFCGCEGVLTLEVGSTFACGDAGLERLVLRGAEYVQHEGRTLVSIRAPRATIKVPSRPGQRRRFTLTVAPPIGVAWRRERRIDVSQRNVAGRVVGGASLVLKPST